MINKALFIKTGTYNDMSLRPYTTNIDNVNLTHMTEIASGSRNKLTSGALAGVASNILSPSANTQGDIEITNGWGEERLRFLIDVTIQQPGLPDSRKIVQGYTDYVGVGSNDSIDPNMRLYFNNIVTLRETKVKTRHGISYKTGITEASQILTGSSDSYLDNEGLHISLRPEDVFTAMGSQEFVAEGVYDLRNTFATQAIKKSRRSNNIPSQYLSGVLDAYTTSNEVHETDYMGGGSGGVYEEASGYISENTITSDSFFIILTMNCEAFARTGNITYSELCGLFPDFDSKATFLVKENRNIQSNIKAPASRGESEEWYGAHLETVWASGLSSSVPSMMMDLMLTNVTFLATNDTLGTLPEIKIFNAHSFAEGIDLGGYIDALIKRLEVEIFNPLSKDNLLSYTVLCTVDILGDTDINITLNGGPSIPYVAPTFCDGLYSPNLAGDSNHISVMAHDLGLVGDLVTDLRLKQRDESDVMDWNRSFSNNQY